MSSSRSSSASSERITLGQAPPNNLGLAPPQVSASPGFPGTPTQASTASTVFASPRDTQITATQGGTQTQGSTASTVFASPRTPTTPDVDFEAALLTKGLTPEAASVLARIGFGSLSMLMEQINDDQKRSDHRPAEPQPHDHSSPITRTTVPCQGCSDFSCVLHWKSYRDGPPETVPEAFEFFSRHGAFESRRRCELHPDAELLWVPHKKDAKGRLLRSGYYYCSHATGKHGNLCRRRFAPSHPYVSNRSVGARRVDPAKTKKKPPGRPRKAKKVVVETREKKVRDPDSASSPSSSELSDDDESSDDDEKDEAENETDGDKADDEAKGLVKAMRKAQEEGALAEWCHERCVTMLTVLHLLILSAYFLSVGIKAQLLCMSHDTVSRLQRLLGEAASRFLQREEDRPMTIIQMDETYTSKRKYHRGKRVRAQGQWFVTVTEVTNGRTVYTRWYPVTFRNRETLTAILRRHAASARVVVTTDAFRAYNHFPEISRHSVINHDQAFVRRDDLGRLVHTNNAEGVHSLIKKWMKREAHGYGRSQSSLIHNANLQTVKLTKDRPDQESTWQLRLRNLLRMTVSAYRHDLGPDEWFERPDERSADFKKAMSILGTREEFGDNTLPRFTPSAPGEGPVNPATVWNFPAPVDRAIAIDAYNSLRPNRMIDHNVVRVVLHNATRHRDDVEVVDPRLTARFLGNPHHESPGFVPAPRPRDRVLIIPVCVWAHWVMFMYDPVMNILYGYDSMGAHPSSVLARAVQVMVNLMFRGDGTQMVSYLPVDTRRPAAAPGADRANQQDVGTVDCAVHAINNALVWLDEHRMLAPEVVMGNTRDSIRNQVFGSRTSESRWQTIVAPADSDHVYAGLQETSQDYDSAVGWISFLSAEAFAERRREVDKADAAREKADAKAARKQQKADEKAAAQQAKKKAAQARRAAARAQNARCRSSSMTRAPSSSSSEECDE